MPVILLDPALPDLIPVGAVSSLGRHVFVTEDVHPSLLWHLPSYEFADEYKQLPHGAALMSTDRAHPLVRELISRGETVVAGDGVKGTRLLEAVTLMDRLRRTGPWERQQTHDSLRRYLVEEVYELLDAFDSGDPAEVRSELGDLLLQVLFFHSRIAEDSGTAPYSIDDVAESFIRKVSYRTPGVLAGQHADLERQIREWEAAKAAERNRGSVLDGIVTTQPVLALTQKLFERLAAADFPRDAISPSISRVDIPFRKHSRDSVEDVQRRNVLALMDQVYAAEAAAAAAGAYPRDENTWRQFLGMTYDEPAAPTPPAEPFSPAEPVEAPAPLAEPFSPAEPVEARVEATFAWPKPSEPDDPPTGPIRINTAFPEAEDFPGPPPPIETVGDDPINTAEREVVVTYSSDVPRMVVTVDRDD
jgi:XTP/dITP diphosphohydrolase